MRNILVIYEQESLSQKLFCDFIEKYCEEKEYSCYSVRSRNVLAKHIDSSDLIITIRSMVPLETRIVELAKKAGIACISYWDDDLIQDTEALFVPRIRRNAMLKELGLVDAVITPNHYLFEKIKAYTNGANEILLDTAVDATELTEKKYGNELVKIVYAAGPSHVKDFDCKIEEAFIKLQKALPNRFSLTFVGVKPELNYRQEFPVEYVPGMSLEAYRKHMCEANYDIGIAPIPNNEFSKSKYYNKYIEYTMVNVIGIYSNWPPYTLIVNHKKNGLLADNTSESWFEALYSAVASEDLRKDILRQAKEQMETYFSFASISKRFSEGIEKLLTDKKSKINTLSLKSAQLQYRAFKYVYLPAVYLKKEGLKGTINRVNNYTSSINLLTRKED